LQLENDDDEDLRLLEDMSNNMGFGDPMLNSLYEDITRHIHLLKYADLSKRVDSLVSINDMIGTITQQTLPVIVKAGNELTSAFVHVMIEIFDKPIEEINLRFAKYFISIVLKTCCCRDVMCTVSQDSVFNLTEQLLTRLLIEGLERVGENKEGDTIQKNLNSAMLRILENCNHTYVMCVLIDL
jgi:hypothetical protein